MKHAESSSEPPAQIDTQARYRTSPALAFPLNALYFLSQLALIALLLPLHTALFALCPSARWRPSWTLTEAVFLPAVKRFMRAMDSGGYRISARRTDRAPSRWERRWIRRRYGVEFRWIDGLTRDLVCGVTREDTVPVREKVGVFSMRRKRCGAARDGEGLVGLWLHGGAYTHNSAHPGAASSSIPWTIFQRESRFSSIHAVEYRLLPDSPFPAALQDAAAAYGSLLRRGISGSQIVLMGDSSGGHLALALARWVRDTRAERADVREEGGWTARPCGDRAILAHSYLGHTASTYVPRRNACDYLFEEPAFRLHLVTSLLGARPASFVLSPYMSPGAPSSPQGSFEGFSPCFVHYGTGERCMDEGARLVQHLERDGVRVEKVVTEDTPHDVLLLAAIWKKRQIEQVWDGVLRFTRALGEV